MKKVTLTLKSILNYFGIEGKKLAEKIGMNDSL